jgi:hypothetical protein
MTRGGSMGVGEDTSLVWGHAMSQAAGCLVWGASGGMTEMAMFPKKLKIPMV